jgi:hypothetical protein
VASIRDVVSNWSVSLPWHVKLWLAAQNLSIRVVKRQTCCGHPGEPGC